MDMKILMPLIAIAALVLYRDKIAQEWQFFRLRRREWIYEKWKNWGEPFVVAALLAIFIRTFIVGPYKIPTGSMRPTFLEGDRIFVDKLSYQFKNPERGDIVVFKYPLDKKKDFVKRLVGFEGDRILIKDGLISVNGQSLNEPPFSDYYYYNRDDWLYGRENVEVVVPKDNYFVLGDNSGSSQDGRYWGFVPKKLLIGKAELIYWPPGRIRFIK